MKRILYHSFGVSDPTSFYRISGVLPYLANPNFELVKGNDIVNWDWTTFNGISIFIFQRPFLPEHYNLILLAKATGTKVILDYDDDLLHVDMFNGTYELYESNKANLMCCLKECDEIWVSTAGIKKSFSEYKKDIYVIPNAHNDYLFPLIEKRPFDTTGKKVIWRGGGSHEADVYAVAANIVDIVNLNQDWEFNFWGHRFTYLEQRCGDNYVCRTTMTIMEYFKELHAYNPQIAIFPLVDNLFNQSKSNIAWMETTYAGAVFFGNINLSEYIEGTIIDLKKLKLNFTITENLGVYNEKSWDYIQQNLLLSNVNKLRTERILENL